MKRSITIRKWGVCIAVLAFWLAIWQIVSLCAPKTLFASPLETADELMRLLQTGTFWLSLSLSLVKVAMGFVLAFGAGLLLAMAAYRFSVLRVLLAPLLQGMKSVPVACFVVVVLIWMGSQNLSIVVSFFVVFPVTYHSILTGLQLTDRKLIEMARVFRTPHGKCWRMLYLPQATPYIRSACRTTVGMCWKAGIAGEIIGLPKHSIGEQIYYAKLYLDTAGLFAWTITIIVISLFLEKLLLRLLGERKGERVYEDQV